MPHPANRSAAVRRVTVRAAATTAGTLAATYLLEGDTDRVHLPPRGPRCVADRLWEHTCCEMFVRLDGPAYYEFNFAPSGDWAGYAFDRYRERAPADAGARAAGVAPQISLRRGAGELALDVLMRLDGLWPRYTPALSLAPAAVIEDTDGTRSYWALAHPAGDPDFHHPDSFRLRLDEVRD